MYLSHINVTMPKHSEAIARMFYSELLGFSAFASKFTHREDSASEGCYPWTAFDRGGSQTCCAKTLC